jgi:hypothetical protein
MRWQYHETRPKVKSQKVQRDLAQHINEHSRIENMGGRAHRFQSEGVFFYLSFVLFLRRSALWTLKMCAQNRIMKLDQKSKVKAAASEAAPVAIPAAAPAAAPTHSRGHRCVPRRLLRLEMSRCIPCALSGTAATEAASTCKVNDF